MSERTFGAIAAKYGLDKKTVSAVVLANGIRHESVGTAKVIDQRDMPRLGSLLQRIVDSKTEVASA